MARAEGGGGARPAMPPIPEVKAHFGLQALEADPAGHLWVRTERGGLDATFFNLFDPGGQYLGEVRVPERMGRFTLARGLLAGVVFDEDETPRISIYAVAGGGW